VPLLYLTPRPKGQTLKWLYLLLRKT
jgi:hypothetical protein